MLGAHAGYLYRNVVARTRDLGASGDRAPVRQQPWAWSKYPAFSGLKTRCDQFRIFRLQCAQYFLQDTDDHRPLLPTVFEQHTRRTQSKQS